MKKWFSMKEKQMPIITHTQLIQAPVNGCFDFARIIDIHTVTTAKTILTTPE